MATPIFIYSLLDPNTGAIRYIGKSTNPTKRLIYHIGHCRARRTHCQRWLWTLKQAGQMPDVQILEAVREDEWPNRERYWIKFYRTHGSVLVNTADGGMGTSGFRHTKEARARMSEYARSIGRRPPQQKTKLARLDNGSAELADWSPDILALLKESVPEVMYEVFGQELEAMLAQGIVPDVQFREYDESVEKWGAVT